MNTEIQNTINQAINTHDSPAAIRILNMAKKDPVLGVDPETLAKLGYIRMNSLSPEQLLDLMHKSILAAYSIPDFNLEERLAEYIELLDSVELEMAFTHGLLKVLDQSVEMIGSGTIKVKGVSAQPTIGNWIEDFSSFPSVGPEKDALAEIEYLNKSANVKILSDEQKGILKNIIKFYDKATHNIALYDSIQVPKSEAELYKDFDLYKLIPEMDEELEEEASRKKQLSASSNSNPNPTQSEVPKPEPLPERPTISLPEDKPVQPKPKPKQSIPVPEALPERPIISLPEEQEEPKNIKRPVNPVHMVPPPSGIRSVDDIINSQNKPVAPLSKAGVVKDPTNVSLDEVKKRMEKEQKKKMEAIQQKLAELKERNNKP